MEQKDKQPGDRIPAQSVQDALPDPEPAVPSLEEPDPGVFHHEPGVAPAAHESKHKTA